MNGFDRWCVPAVRKSQSYYYEEAVCESRLPWNMDSSLCSSSTLTQDGRRETGAVLPHCVQYVFTSTHLLPNHFKIYWSACRKKKWVQRQSFIGNGGHWRPLLTSLNWWKRLSVFEENNAQKVQSHMTMKEVKPYVTLPSFSVLVSEIEILLDDAL